MTNDWQKALSKADHPCQWTGPAISLTVLSRSLNTKRSLNTERSREFTFSKGQMLNGIAIHRSRRAKLAQGIVQGLLGEFPWHVWLGLGGNWRCF